MAAINQNYIQKYWFGEVFAEDVMNTYGIVRNNGTAKAYDLAMDILKKSKRDFVGGSPIVFKDDIDRKIHSAICTSR